MPQPNFFGQSDGPPLLNKPANKPRRRRFYYDGDLFKDPGAEYSIEAVRDWLAKNSYPELANATWTSGEVVEDKGEEFDVITFIKVTGEKGAVTPPQIMDCLAGVKPAPQVAKVIELTNRLVAVESSGPLDAGRLLAMAPEIEATLGQAERIGKESAEVVERCLALKPIPLPKVPLGF